MYHLVTGACGFVGSSIVEKLVLQGYKVVSLDVKRDQRVEEISNFYLFNIFISRSETKVAIPNDFFTSLISRNLVSKP